MKAKWRHPAEKPTATDGTLCLRADTSQCLMVWLLELQRNATSEELIKLSSRFRHWTIVFVHSSANFSPMVEARVIFEALPPLTMLHAHQGLCDWSAWLQDRRALLMSKWAPNREICYGLSFHDYISAVPKCDYAVN